MSTHYENTAFDDDTNGVESKKYTSFSTRAAEKEDEKSTAFDNVSIKKSLPGNTENVKLNFDEIPKPYAGKFKLTSYTYITLV